MRKEKFSNLKTVFWLSLIHHPLCARYRHHVIQIGSKKFCLGCTGFYSGMIIGIVFSLGGIFKGWDWNALALTAFILYGPIMLYMVGIRINKKYRVPRFLVKFSLGLGVLIGILAILKAELFAAISMFLFGVFLYLLLGISRIATTSKWEECENCSFERSPQCPGFKLLLEYFPMINMNIHRDEKSEVFNE